MTVPFSKPGDVLLVGCGRMGGALLEGWISAGVQANHVMVVDPYFSPSAALSNVSVVKGFSELPGDLSPKLVVLAVKPQLMDEVLPSYKVFVESGALFVSVAAGRPLAYFAAQLGDNVPVIRVMPNLPATVGKGASGAVANGFVDESQRQLVTQLMEAVGSLYWLSDETQMDALTAVSGSGPAYVFYFIECLQQAAVDAGLPEDLAQQLALDTVWGSAELAHSSGRSVQGLREQVTSPNGTTAAGLKQLMAGDVVKDVLKSTVKAAAQRSRELSD